MLLNVLNGTARPDINGGTSMQNYANANAVADLMVSYLANGVKPGEIAILTMYKDQQAITKQKLVEKTADEELPGKLRTISTIDAFQGQESPVVILDLVAANRSAGGPASREINPQEAMGAWQKVSKYAQEPNRITVGLTRAQYAMTIVCHVPTIMDTAKFTRVTPQGDYSTLALLVQDAEQYGWIATCTAEDDHPRAAQEAEAIAQANSDKDAALGEKKKLTYIAETKNAAQVQRQVHDSQNQPFQLPSRTQFSEKSASSSQEPTNVRRQEASARKAVWEASEEARHALPKSKIERIPNPNVNQDMEMSEHHFEDERMEEWKRALRRNGRGLFVKSSCNKGDH